MTKEELMALGLTEEQAKGVFALKGKVIEHEQSKAKELLDKANATNEELSNELKSVKADLKTYSKQAADNEELANSLKAREEALTAAEEARKQADQQQKFDTALNARAKELKLRNPDDLKRFLDLEKVKLKDDNTFEGLDDQITTLQANNGYLFEGDIKAGYAPNTGGTPDKPVNSLSEAIANHYNK